MTYMYTYNSEFISNYDVDLFNINLYLFIDTCIFIIHISGNLLISFVKGRLHLARDHVIWTVETSPLDLEHQMYQTMKTHLQ